MFRCKHKFIDIIPQPDLEIGVKWCILYRYVPAGISTVHYRKISNITSICNKCYHEETKLMLLRIMKKGDRHSWPMRSENKAMREE